MTSHLHRCIIGLAALTLVIAGCAGSSGVAETAVEAESSTTVTVVETTVPTTPSTVPRATCPEDESGELRAVIEAQTFAISQATLLRRSRIPRRPFVRTPQPNSLNA